MKFSNPNYFRFLLWFSVFLLFSLTALFDLAGPNPSSRFLLTKSISLTGNTWFPEEWIHIVYVGPDFAQVGEKFYSDKSPGLSLLFVPVYIIINFVLENLVGLHESILTFSLIDRVFISITQIILSLFNAWAVVRFYDILKKLRFPVFFALVSSLLFGFGSLFFIYASTFLPHALIATILLEIFYRLLEIQENKNEINNSIIIGFLLGSGAIFEYVVLFIVPICCLYVMIPFKSQNNKYLSYSLLRSNFFSTIKHLFTTDSFIRRLVFSLLILINSIIFFLPFFLYNKISFGDIGITAYSVSHWYNDLHFYTPFNEGFNEIFLVENKGLIYLTPIIIIGFLGFIVFAKHFPKEFLFSFSVFWVYLYFYSKYFTPYGGEIYGPRYIIPIIPLLYLGIAFWVYYTKSSKFSVIISSLLGILTLFNNAMTMFISYNAPFWNRFYEHPIFVTSFTNLNKFINGDKYVFRSGIFRLCPFIFIIILVIGLVIILILLWSSRKPIDEFESNNYQLLSDNRLKNELKTWTMLILVVFTCSFIYQISIILSKGYNDIVYSEIVYYWNYYRPRPPYNIIDIPFFDFLIILIFIVLLAVYFKRLLKSYLKKELPSE